MERGAVRLGGRRPFQQHMVEGIAHAEKEQFHRQGGVHAESMHAAVRWAGSARGLRTARVVRATGAGSSTRTHARGSARVGHHGALSAAAAATTTVEPEARSDRWSPTDHVAAL